MSLAEFAASTTRKRTCAVCTRLPEEVRREIDLGPDIGPTIISRWLVTQGHDITISQITHHRKYGHNEA